MYHSDVLSPSTNVLFVSRFGEKCLPKALNVNANVNVMFFVAPSLLYCPCYAKCVRTCCIAPSPGPARCSCSPRTAPGTSEALPRCQSCQAATREISKVIRRRKRRRGRNTPLHVEKVLLLEYISHCPVFYKLKTVFNTFSRRKEREREKTEEERKTENVEERERRGERGRESWRGGRRWEGEREREERCDIIN